jgi:hypothetical protein
MRSRSSSTQRRLTHFRPITGREMSVYKRIGQRNVKSAIIGGGMASETDAPCKPEPPDRPAAWAGQFRLVQLPYVARLPRLIEESPRRSIEPQNHEVPFARQGPQPVLSGTRRIGPKIDVRRAVNVASRLVHRVDGWERLPIIEPGGRR